jgi:hypothetical protein
VVFGRVLYRIGKTKSKEGNGMANEVIFKRKGRTYRLIVDGSDGFDCAGCAFFGHSCACPTRESDGFFACTFGDGKNHIFIETPPIKILRPIRIILSAIRDVFYFSATGQGRGNKHQKENNR